MLRDKDLTKVDRTHPLMTWETVDDDMGLHPLFHLTEVIQKRGLLNGEDLSDTLPMFTCFVGQKGA